MTASLITVVFAGAIFMALAHRGPWPRLRPYGHLGLWLPAGLALLWTVLGMVEQDWWRALLYGFCAVVLGVAGRAVYRLAKMEREAERAADVQ